MLIFLLVNTFIILQILTNWVELVLSCGGEDLKNFLDRTGTNAVYTSYVAVVEFIEDLGIWVEESLLKQLCKPFISVSWLMSVQMLRPLRSCQCSVDGQGGK